MTRLSRRTLVSAALLAAGVAAAPRAFAEDKVFRIAYQKGGGILVLLKQRGTIAEKLKPLGWSVSWAEFPAGPQLLEALNVGVADFGPVGEAPPIFAQAAGADIVYAGSDPPSPKNEAIIVPKDSPIRTIADLKGKRVALNKGSNVHYLLIQALETNGLAYGDIESVYLPPADARAAFERGAVDAWVIWDPYYAAAELSLGARTIADGTGLAPNVSFYIATRQITERHADVVTAALATIDNAEAWVRDNPGKAAAELAPIYGLPVEVVERFFTRSIFGAHRVDDATLTGQQKVADAFAKLKLIPKPINVRDAAWKQPA
ncbi:MAG: sulfonate ABC transporter substrate-binding protein [Alphaproteobacteria bacterium]|nr:sulfonate ABC transporter substrate-binding protein [Alphaproteobacteria bacterium]